LARPSEQQEIIVMLARKLEIERQNRLVNNMVADTGWVADAIELLLRIELERSKE
jgi:hypothetical protein